jgi:DNA-directed RNA polymerase subunit RPC12/RpoP
MRLLQRFLRDIEQVYWCKRCGERLKSLEKAKAHVRGDCGTDIKSKSITGFMED